MWEYIFFSLVILYYVTFCCLAAYSLFQESRESNNYNQIINNEV